MKLEMYERKLKDLFGDEQFFASFIDVIEYDRIYPRQLLMIVRNQKRLAVEPAWADKMNHKSKHIVNYFK